MLEQLNNLKEEIMVRKKQVNKKGGARKKRMPRHQFEGYITWKRLRYPKSGNREHGKMLSLGIGFEGEVPESVNKQAKSAGQAPLIKEKLKYNKKYKNRTVWCTGFEEYIKGDLNVDVGDEVLITTTLQFNESEDGEETYTNFSIREIDLLESAEDFDDEDEDEESEDEESEDEESEDEDDLD